MFVEGNNPTLRISNGCREKSKHDNMSNQSETNTGNGEAQQPCIASGLLGCPFCGGNAMMSRPYESMDVVVIGCYEPTCQSHPKVEGVAELMARNRWNRRVFYDQSSVTR